MVFLIAVDVSSYDVAFVVNTIHDCRHSSWEIDNRKSIVAEQETPLVTIAGALRKCPCNLAEIVDSQGV